MSVALKGHGGGPGPLSSRAVSVGFALRPFSGMFSADVFALTEELKVCLCSWTQGAVMGVEVHLRISDLRLGRSLDVCLPFPPWPLPPPPPPLPPLPTPLLCASAYKLTEWERRAKYYIFTDAPALAQSIFHFLYPSAGAVCSARATPRVAWYCQATW